MGRVTGNRTAHPPNATHVSSSTPLPKVQMAVLAIAMPMEAICSSMLLPFVGLYVAHLQNWPPEDAGYVSGFLIGLFMLGQVASSILWGRVSDTYGRKAPLVSGLFAGSITVLFFGLSPNLYICCVLRFIHGVFNGNTLVCKTIIAEITDATNVAKGFALMNITWGAGCLLGPALGGFLYDPAGNPHLWWLGLSADGFFRYHPAFLPSLVVSVITMIATMACFFWLEESNPHARPITEAVPSCLQWLLLTQRPPTISDSAVPTCAEKESHRVELSQEPHATSSHHAHTRTPREVVTTSAFGLSQALQDESLRLVLLLYVLLCAADMTMSEVMPLWAIAPTVVGGLALLSDEVGVIFLTGGVPTVVANMFFPRVSNLIGDYFVFWRCSMKVFLVSLVLVPFGSWLGTNGGFWYVLIVNMVKQVGSAWSYGVVHLLTAKMAPPGNVGAAYGIAQTCASMTRCVVPFVVAPLFAWSLAGHHPFPFNHFLLFFLAGVPLTVAIWRSSGRHMPVEVPQSAPTRDEESRDGMVESVANSVLMSFAGSFCCGTANERMDLTAVMVFENEASIESGLPELKSLDTGHLQCEGERIDIGNDEYCKWFD